MFFLICLLSLVCSLIASTININQVYVLNRTSEVLTFPKNQAKTVILLQNLLTQVQEVKIFRSKTADDLKLEENFLECEDISFDQVCSVEISDQISYFLLVCKENCLYNFQFIELRTELSNIEENSEFFLYLEDEKYDSRVLIKNKPQNNLKVEGFSLTKYYKFSIDFYLGQLFQDEIQVKTYRDDEYQLTKLLQEQLEGPEFLGLRIKSWGPKLLKIRIQFTEQIVHLSRSIFYEDFNENNHTQVYQISNLQEVKDNILIEYYSKQGLSIILVGFSSHPETLAMNYQWKSANSDIFIDYEQELTKYRQQNETLYILVKSLKHSAYLIKFEELKENLQKIQTFVGPEQSLKFYSQSSEVIGLQILSDIRKDKKFQIIFEGQVQKVDIFCYSTTETPKYTELNDPEFLQNLKKTTSEVDYRFEQQSIIFSHEYVGKDIFILVKFQDEEQIFSDNLLKSEFKLHVFGQEVKLYQNILQLGYLEEEQIQNYDIKNILYLDFDELSVTLTGVKGQTMLKFKTNTVEHTVFSDSKISRLEIAKADIPEKAEEINLEAKCLSIQCDFNLILEVDAISFSSPMPLIQGIPQRFFLFQHNIRLFLINLENLQKLAVIQIETKLQVGSFEVRLYDFNTKLLIQDIKEEYILLKNEDLHTNMIEVQIVSDIDFYNTNSGTIKYSLVTGDASLETGRVHKFTTYEDEVFPFEFFLEKNQIYAMIYYLGLENGTRIDFTNMIQNQTSISENRNTLQIYHNDSSRLKIYGQYFIQKFQPEQLYRNELLLMKIDSESQSEQMKLIENKIYHIPVPSTSQKIFTFRFFHLWNEKAEFANLQIDFQNFVSAVKWEFTQSLESSLVLSDFERSLMFSETIHREYESEFQAFSETLKAPEFCQDQNCYLTVSVFGRNLFPYSTNLFSIHIQNFFTDISQQENQFIFGKLFQKEPLYFKLHLAKETPSFSILINSLTSADISTTFYHQTNTNCKFNKKSFINDCCELVMSQANSSMIDLEDLMEGDYYIILKNVESVPSNQYQFQYSTNQKHQTLAGFPFTVQVYPSSVESMKFLYKFSKKNAHYLSFKFQQAGANQAFLMLYIFNLNAQQQVYNQSVFLKQQIIIPSQIACPGYLEFEACEIEFSFSFNESKRQKHMKNSFNVIIEELQNRKYNTINLLSGQTFQFSLGPNMEQKFIIYGSQAQENYLFLNSLKGEVSFRFIKEELAIQDLGHGLFRYTRQNQTLGNQLIVVYGCQMQEKCIYQITKWTKEEMLEISLNEIFYDELVPQQVSTYQFSSDFDVLKIVLQNQNYKNINKYVSVKQTCISNKLHKIDYFRIGQVHERVILSPLANCWNSLIEIKLNQTDHPLTYSITAVFNGLFNQLNPIKMPYMTSSQLEFTSYQGTLGGIVKSSKFSFELHAKGTVIFEVYSQLPNPQLLMAESIENLELIENKLEGITQNYYTFFIFNNTKEENFLFFELSYDYLNSSPQYEYTVSVYQYEDQYFEALTLPIFKVEPGNQGKLVLKSEEKNILKVEWQEVHFDVQTYPRELNIEYHIFVSQEKFLLNHYFKKNQGLSDYFTEFSQPGVETEIIIVNANNFYVLNTARDRNLSYTIDITKLARRNHSDSLFISIKAVILSPSLSQMYPHYHWRYSLNYQMTSTSASILSVRHEPNWFQLIIAGFFVLAFGLLMLFLVYKAIKFILFYFRKDTSYDGFAQPDSIIVTSKGNLKHQKALSIEMKDEQE